MKLFLNNLYFSLNNSSLMTQSLLLALVMLLAISCNDGSTEAIKSNNDKPVVENNENTSKTPTATLDEGLFGRWEGPEGTFFEFREDGTALEGGQIGEYEREWSCRKNKFCLLATESGIEMCLDYQLLNDNQEMTVSISGQQLGFVKQ